MLENNLIVRNLHQKYQQISTKFREIFTIVQNENNGESLLHFKDANIEIDNNNKDKRLRNNGVILKMVIMEAQ